MPTYKHAKFIRRAINSLHSQTFEDWELIIINDNSPDNTQDVIKDHLKDIRIHYRKNGMNCGLGKF